MTFDIIYYKNNVDFFLRRKNNNFFCIFLMYMCEFFEKFFNAKFEQKNYNFSISSLLSPVILQISSKS